MNKEQSIAYHQTEQMIKLSEDKKPSYHKWFLERSEFFSEVDIFESKLVAEKVEAELKHCFHNCWKALSTGKYKYFEGSVASKAIPIPMEHCWLVKDGMVVDPTLILDVDEKIKNRLGDQYLGIEIPFEYAMKMGFKLKMSGPYLPHYFLERFWKKRRKENEFKKEN